MKIALFTSSRTTIPPEKNVIAASATLTGHLADGLVEKGHDVTLFAPQGSVSKAHIVDLGVSPSHSDYALNHEEWVKNFNLGMKLLYIGELYKRASEFDIIHLQTEPVYLGMSFAHLTSTPTVFTNHNPFLEQEKRLLEYYKDLPITTISNYQRQVVPTLNYVATIYDGINANAYPFVATPNTNSMVFLGRLVGAKGVKEAIEVAKLTGKSLQISGVGTEEFIQATVTPHLSATISFAGPVERDSPLLFERLGNAYLTLFPIQWEEPFGLVMIESMACGTPVVAFARGSVPEIIKDGETGFIINPSDDDIRGDFLIKKTGKEGLAEAIEKIYSMSDSEYQTMRQKCRTHVESTFTIEKMVDGYEKVYQQLAQK